MYYLVAGIGFEKIRFLSVPRNANGQKRPADAIGCAVMVAKIATGEVEDTALKQPAKHANGLAGSKARLNNTRTKDANCQESGKREVDQMDDAFKKNRKAFNSEEKKLNENYSGKFVLFAEGEFQGAYNDLHDAYDVGVRYHREGNFYIREIHEQASQMGFMGIFV